MVQLNTSPFGLYTTWIAKSNYISFLNAYKGYSLPKDQDGLKKVQSALRELQGKSAAKGDPSAGLTKGVVDDASAAKGINSVQVTYDTILNARGTRKDEGVPDQGALMGGSAATVSGSTNRLTAY